jgi:ribonuclease BN (tRNA processing enzyme)
LYIAGSSSAVPRPGRANSGYLLRTSGCAIAIDLGSGALARLREAIDIADLDAVVISHMHADHFIDLIALRYALRYEMQRPKPLTVYVPPGAIEILSHVVRPLKETDNFFGGIYDLREYAPGEPLQIGDCSVRFVKTLHYIPCYAMRIETPAGVLGFSADTAPCEAVPTLVRGADVFLCEAALGAYGRENGKRGHLNAHEAGEMAARAEVQHLVLTHYSANAGAVDMREAAAAAFKGPITIADDGIELTLRTTASI